jgi:predicted AlkP superfamily pyrophosphatase or phosphodiesterase
VLVLDVVGLTPRWIGEATPNLRALAARGACAPMEAVLPAVTCSAQATMLTGRTPAEHGAVGNGWFFRDVAEGRLWQQANWLVEGEKVYETARALDPSFTCAKLFWWWNLGAAVGWSITPRPHYCSDGLKILDVYGKPDAWVDELKARHGPFPFFDFWGPKAGLGSSRWIADVALATLREQRPTLTLVYLPHLDYDHQRFGVSDPRAEAAVREVDAIVGDLLVAADEIGAAVVVVSEYGLEDASRPVHPNRALREAGLLEVRHGPVVGETLDPFASRAFCVSDHQLAHVVVRDPAARARTMEVLGALPGVAAVLDDEGKAAHGLAHPRAGDLVLVAEKGAWFTYYWWLDDARAPDFARTVDIHRKPGYDPCELFVDPALRFPKLRVARRLAQKLLGFRYLMDVIPLRPELVRGTHGRLPDGPEDGPVFVCSRPFAECGGEPEGGRVAMTSVRDRILALLGRE